MPGMMDTFLNIGIPPNPTSSTLRKKRRQTEIAFQEATGSPLPDTPLEQLFTAINAVKNSWNSRRAQEYRNLHGFSNAGGTAVIVQSMVDGTASGFSGTGIFFSRDLNSGSPSITGEWAINQNGERLASGTLNPNKLLPPSSLPKAVFYQVETALKSLEFILGFAAEIEVTFENGKVWFLQARKAQTSPYAADRIIEHLSNEKIIVPQSPPPTTDSPSQHSTTHQFIAEEYKEAVLSGSAIGQGFAVGKALQNPNNQTRDHVFIAKNTKPEDIPLMSRANAVVTERGGASSHAAVICRGLGIPAVVGCGDGALRKIENRDVAVDAAAGKVYLKSPPNDSASN